MKTVLGNVLLTVSQWYAFFLLSQLSLFLYPPQYGVLVFALGFVGRILGSVLFGYIGDKVDRKLSLTLTTVVLALSSVMVILYYTYPTTLAFRLLQGLSLGGEWGGASTVVIEAYSESRLRGFFASLVQLAVPISVILSSFSLFLLSFYSLSDWRFCLVFPVVLSIFSTLFIKDVKSVKGGTGIPIINAIRDDWKDIVKAIGIKVSESANFYIFTSFVFSEPVGTNEVSTLVAIAVAIQLLLLPLFGYLSDVLGRKSVVFLGAALMALGSFLFSSNLTLGEVVLSISDASLYAPQSSIFTELFNREYRFTASNFSYQVASLLGGTLAPVVLRLSGYGVLQVSLPYVVVTVVSLTLIKETKGKRI
ncbi:MFS transporter [Stygiolobus caldivivus]|uniref:MFS transporter n=1 Tax=Stygiolobus caldivivus TaxID=2824673 RepID=A0A8D5U5J3_9CREN|nr:MFS transporter [Stygiolobus caldivivus]BCU69881.1 MFS transporter [Stygiolobus caldivivus]